MSFAPAYADRRISCEEDYTSPAWSTPEPGYSGSAEIVVVVEEP